MFEIESEDREARTGVLRTPHGRIETPAFLPVATKGCVKTLSSGEVVKTKTQALIANAFLLYLKPGVEVISRAGGLHAFMNWSKAIFTDSGGFQMLRESFLLGVSRRGIRFRSPYDNSRHLFTPEKCMEVQGKLGSDVALALDDLPAYGSSYERVAEAVARTVDWARRCREAREGMLFAILQGGVYKELRRKCVEKLAGMEFEGYGIGGLSIGEPKEATYRVIRETLPLLPGDKPRYLMGVGSPVEVLRAVALGIDLFDSAFPTRNARHSTAYTLKGKVNLSRGRYSADFSPISEGCGCYACRNYSRAYISHLLRVRETLGMKLVTMHNLYFIQELLRRAREAIKKGEFQDFKAGVEGRYGSR
jgi:queuine tRNA-ribosyltransferase